MSHTIKLNQIGVEERGKGVNLTIDPYAYICRTSTITTINSLTERPRPLSLQPPPPAPAGWTLSHFKESPSGGVLVGILVILACV